MLVFFNLIIVFSICVAIIMLFVFVTIAINKLKINKLICPKCGNKISNGNKFCTTCGYKIS